MMNIFILAFTLILAILPLIHATELALTFDINDNTCTAQCGTNKETSSGSFQSPDNTQLIQHLINATLNNTQAINDVMNKLDSVIVSLTHLKNTTDSNAGGINDILLLVEQILKLQNTSSHSSGDIVFLPKSCQDIKNKQPNSPSGFYLLANYNSGETKYVYCHMGKLCGTGGGWTRLAYLDMSDATENCPSGFRLYESGGVRACGRPTNDSGSGSCQSVQFPSNGFHYSQICGRVIGYQVGHPDAVDPGSGHHNDINSYYVDGVSITRGSPRQHVWTLMAGVYGSSINAGNCPCAIGSDQNSTLQSFIGQDYFCESGVDSNWSSNVMYPRDPLWDGKGCGTLESICCSAPGLPWFHKVLNSTTTDYIELRVCTDYSTTEDVPVGFYEIFIK